MFKSIVEFFRSIFNDPVISNDLEAYILAGDPRSAEDVDRLEREFRIQRKQLNRYWEE